MLPKSCNRCKACSRASLFSHLYIAGSQEPQKFVQTAEVRKEF